MGSLKKNCKTPGCRNLHRNPDGYCDECKARYAASHPKEERKENRPTARQRGYTAEWDRFAARFLRNHSMCAICGMPSTKVRLCVDHKDMPADVMLRVYGGKFDLDESHYQALCGSCNAEKGKNADVRFRRKFEEDMRRLEQGGGLEKNDQAPRTGAVRSENCAEG